MKVSFSAGSLGPPNRRHTETTSLLPYCHRHRRLQSPWTVMPLLPVLGPKSMQCFAVLTALTAGGCGIPGMRQVA